MTRLLRREGHRVSIDSFDRAEVEGAVGAGLAAILMDPLGRYPGRVDCPRIRRLAELLDLLDAGRL